MWTVTLVHGLLPLVLLVLGSLKETLVYLVALLLELEVAVPLLPCSLVAVVTVLILVMATSAGATGAAAD